MARKKIESKKKVDAGGVQSKTARASMAKGKKQEGFIASGEMDRIISLSRGEYLYLLDPRDGRTHHLRTGSDKYQDMVTAILNTGHGERLSAELVKKGFPLPHNPCEDIPMSNLGPGEFRPEALENA